MLAMKVGGGGDAEGRIMAMEVGGGEAEEG